MRLAGAVMVGADAILECEDRSGGICKVLLFGGPAMHELSIGDECAIRFRPSRRPGDPDRWDFAGKATAPAG